MVSGKRQGEVINLTYTCVCVHGLPYMKFICLIPTFGWTSLERIACFILVMMMDDSLGTLLIWFVSPVCTVNGKNRVKGGPCILHIYCLASRVRLGP